ncbi:protein FAM200A-like [Macrobrachium rosenbergii]|uniref:protein FAM200A-like n=1 Tax=Macrobrachium rosenbergii TaxID=79674 RepID=UPI0034D685B0
MLGLQSGFITRVKEKNPSAVGTHCILHREALASRTLPAEMRDVLNVAIKVVNFIKAGALNSRLFTLVIHQILSRHSVADISEEVQEEFLELKFNSTAEVDFKELDLETFWIKYLPVYPLISRQALRILTMFGSTYLCEAAFSILVAVKTKYRNRLKNIEGDLRCALSGIQPRIQDLVAQKQCQASH